MKFSEEEKEKFERAAEEMSSDAAHFTASVAILIKGYIKFISRIMPAPLALTCFETFKEDIDGVLDATCSQLRKDVGSMDGWFKKLEEMTEPEEMEDDLGIEDEE